MKLSGEMRSLSKWCKAALPLRVLAACAPLQPDVFMCLRVRRGGVVGIWLLQASPTGSAVRRRGRRWREKR
ncbi:hypothetical protein EYF80_014058 [Liparis tanakae]|uniref:Uncharacterized protein n=1 Tax=Liparis tanakae TaxID=230148 RepID=A0A4Z2IDR4_9TELE|nr:hypothetical protein EYF80_014058 [Liparis tanakae]